MARVKKVIFDTSALNRLHDNPNRDKIIEQLKARFRVRLLETNIGELFATPETERRISLLKLCRECLTFGDCLLPHQEIITQMAQKHRKMGNGFRWQNVDVTAPQLTDALLRDNLWNDETLSFDQRENLSETAKRFLTVLRESKEKFKEGYENEPILTLKEFKNILKAEGGGFWKTGMGLYKRATGIELGERRIKNFLSECPPFHAVAMVSVMGHFQYGLPKDHTPSKYKAHFYDLLMGCQLPYCDVFVTNEDQQKNCLEVVAKEIGVSVKCLRWIEFSGRLLGNAISATA